MAGSVEAVIEAIHEQIAGFHPGSGEELDRFIADLTQIPRELASAIGTTAESWHDEHIHPSVIEATKEYAGALGSTADAGDEAFSEHRAQHGFWLNGS